MDLPSQKSTLIVDEALWKALMKNLSSLYGGSIQLVLPDEWNEKYFTMFHEIEEEKFRVELRYSYDEITKLLTKPKLLFFFILANDKPEILVLGYSLEHEQRIFYLDTFVVRQSGRGVGRIILKFLMELTHKKGYRKIILDTEEEDQKGIPLRKFYEKNGFRVIARTETGNLTMSISL